MTEDIHDLIIVGLRIPVRPAAVRAAGGGLDVL